MSGSPTQRSLKLLRDDGYTADVVERWIPGANIRRDLYGFIDIVALKGPETLAVQCCSDNGGSGIAAHVRKIADSPTVGAVREAGWRLEVHGWRKVGARYRVRVVDCS